MRSPAVPLRATLAWRWSCSHAAEPLSARGGFVDSGLNASLAPSGQRREQKTLERRPRHHRYRGWAGRWEFRRPSLRQLDYPYQCSISPSTFRSTLGCIAVNATTIGTTIVSLYLDAYESMMFVGRPPCRTSNRNGGIVPPPPPTPTHPATSPHPLGGMDARASRSRPLLPILALVPVVVQVIMLNIVGAASPLVLVVGLVAQSQRPPPLMPSVAMGILTIPFATLLLLPLLLL